MRLTESSTSWKLGAVLTVGLLLSATSVVADVGVTVLPVDTTTGGDWRGVYGECFFLIPQPPGPHFEYPLGPDAFSQNPGQYEGTNCYGGDLLGAVEQGQHLAAVVV